MKKSSKKYLGFTLVELIIVITILAILATIAFVSFQNYTSQTRDTNRLTSIKTIEKGLQLTFTTTSTYPIPDSKVDILSYGSIIGYQGNVGYNVSSIIKSSKTLDPLDGKYYTYSTNKKLTKYELMTLAETQNVITYLPQTYALTRYVKIFGDKIGIITDTNNTPIQETGTGVDVNTTTGTYKAYISNGTTEVTGTGNSLNVLNISMGVLQPKSCLEILNSKQATTDGVYDINPTGTGSFKVYCDMTTDSGGWTLAVRIKADGQKNHGQSGSYGILVSKDQSLTAKLSDTSINNIKSEGVFRFTCGDKTAYYKINDGIWAFNHNTGAGNLKSSLTYNGTYIGVKHAEGTTYGLTNYMDDNGTANPLGGFHQDYVPIWNGEGTPNYGCYSFPSWGNDGYLFIK